MKPRREVRAVWPVTKAGDIPLSWVYPLTEFVPTPFQYQSEPRTERSEKPAARKTRDAFAPREARHSFAIEAVPRSGSLKSRPYLYTCVRCKWCFRVNDRPGSIVTLDYVGRPLPEPESSLRAATFAAGPCPAFGPRISEPPAELQSPGSSTRMLRRLARGLKRLWRRWTGEKPRRVPADPAATMMITTENRMALFVLRRFARLPAWSVAFMGWDIQASGRRQRLYRLLSRLPRKDAVRPLPVHERGRQAAAISHAEGQSV